MLTMVAVGMESTQDWIKRKCPIIGLYSPSGEGKTTFISTLFEDDDYWPTLYLDADEGDTTIAKYTRNPKIVDYRSKTQRPQDQTVFTWLARALKEARTSKHKVIVIEGMTRYRDNLSGDFLIDNPDQVEKPRGMMKSYQKPSALLGAVFAAASNIQDVRKRSNTGALIIFSFNVKEIRIELGSKVETYWAPKLSPNLTESIMGRSDLFAELERPTGQKLRLHTRRSTYNHQRKCRNEEVARALSDMRDPKLPDILDKWAQVEQQQTDKLAADWTPETNPETENTET